MNYGWAKLHTYSMSCQKLLLYFIKSVNFSSYFQHISYFLNILYQEVLLLMERLGIWHILRWISLSCKQNHKRCPHCPSPPPPKKKRMKAICCSLRKAWHQKYSYENCRRWFFQSSKWLFNFQLTATVRTAISAGCQFDENLLKHFCLVALHLFCFLYLLVIVLQFHFQHFI